MENYLVWGACALYVINTIIGLKIFARTEELNKLEASLMKYAMEHFLTKETYNINHQFLQEQITNIHRDISDMKDLLIKVIAKES